MEAVRWAPPVMSFRIERHVAMTRGSTRAELQVWRIDIERNSATCVSSRTYRQHAPRTEPVKTAPIAGEIADAIAAGRDDERLIWGRDGKVRVMLAEVLPQGPGTCGPVPGAQNNSVRRLRDFWQTAAGVRSGRTFTRKGASE